SFTGKYFNNLDLTGIPVLTRIDNTINFDWGLGSPDPSINKDYFSVLWEGILDAQDGDYLISIEHDDGMRIYIDDLLVHDHWTNLTYEEENFNVRLNDEKHIFRIEYYDSLYKSTAIFNVKKL